MVFDFSKNASEICPTLKSSNFFAIGPILITSDVSESSGPLLFHNRVYFPGRFHESSPNRWIRNSWLWWFCQILVFLLEIVDIGYLDISKMRNIPPVDFFLRLWLVQPSLLTNFEANHRMALIVTIVSFVFPLCETWSGFTYIRMVRLHKDG